MMPELVRLTLMGRSRRDVYGSRTGLRELKKWRDKVEYPDLNLNLVAAYFSGSRGIQNRLARRLTDFQDRLSQPLLMAFKPRRAFDGHPRLYESAERAWISFTVPRLVRPC